MSIPRDLTPADLDFPTKYTSFREVQLQIADWFIYGDADLGRRRFMMVGAPGGVGKTGAQQLISKIMGVKTVILTYTLGLEDQIIGDKFQEVIDVRGRVNYECVTRNHYQPDKRWMCDEGEEIDCDCLGTNRCTYQQAVNEAKASRVVLTNYAYWLHARKFGGTALEGSEHGPVKLLVCDECHLAPQSISNMLACWIGKTDLHHWVDNEVRMAVRLAHGADHGIVTQSWIEALTVLSVRLKHRMGEIARGYRSEAEAYRKDKEFKKLSKLSDDVERVIFHATDNNWIWQETKTGYKFDCIWPAKYAERYLFSGVQNVLLISATARPKLLQLLGIKQEQVLFREWPRIFPAVNGPVIHIPTGRMGQKSDEAEKRKSVARLDEFLDLGWKNVKGLVQTASYPRAEWVQANSKYGRWMLLNKRGESADAMADRFRKAKCDEHTPCILVSPSYGTGYDFDLYDQQILSWNFVLKLPWADQSDPIVQARLQQDRDWGMYACAQSFWQSTWRFTRRPEAKCMTIVTDDSINFLLRRGGKQHGPRWVTVQERNELPKPPIGIGTRAHVSDVSDTVNGTIGTDVLPAFLPVPTGIEKRGIDFAARVKDGKRILPSSLPSSSSSVQQLTPLGLDADDEDYIPF